MEEKVSEEIVPRLCNLPELLTVAEAARVLRVSEQLVTKLIRAGQVPAICLGARRLVPNERLQSLIAGGGVATPLVPVAATKRGPRKGGSG